MTIAEPSHAPTWSARKPALTLIAGARERENVPALLRLDFEVRDAPAAGPGDACVAAFTTRGEYRGLIAAVRERTRAPLVVVLREGGLDERVDALESGADDVLVEPYDAGELLARLRAVMRRGDARAGTVIRIGDVEFEAERGAVRRGASTLVLTGIERGFFLALVKREGAVAAYDELRAEVWGRPVSANTVHVCASYVRAKLHDGLGAPLIRTVRGSGYALAV